MKREGYTTNLLFILQIVEKISNRDSNPYTVFLRGSIVAGPIYNDSQLLPVDADILMDYRLRYGHDIT